MSAERTPKWGRHDLNTHKEALHLPSPRQPPSAGFSRWFWERSSRRIVIGRHVTQTRSAAHDVHISSLLFHLNVLDFTTRSIQSHVTNLSLLLLLLWQRIVKETHNYLLNNGPLSSKHRPASENNGICPMESNNNISGRGGVLGRQGAQDLRSPRVLSLWRKESVRGWGIGSICGKDSRWNEGQWLSEGEDWKKRIFWVTVLLSVRTSLWGLETVDVSLLVLEKFMPWWRSLSESGKFWGKVGLHLRNPVPCEGVLSLWRSRSGPSKGWGQQLDRGRVVLWLSSAPWAMGSVCGEVSPSDATCWVILPWIPGLIWGRLHWLWCSFNKGSLCEGLLFSATSWSLLEQRSGGLLSWAGCDPEGKPGSWKPRERSLLWGALAVLVFPVCRMLHIVLVRRLLAGTVSGLWTNVLDSALNL